MSSCNSLSLINFGGEWSWASRSWTMILVSFQYLFRLGIFLHDTYQYEARDITPSDTVRCMCMLPSWKHCIRIG